jgi:hypothetical protein
LNPDPISPDKSGEMEDGLRKREVEYSGLFLWLVFIIIKNL